MKIGMKVLSAAAIALLSTASFSRAGAQAQTSVKSDLLLRVDGPVSIGPSDTVGTVVVIGNDATVRGQVKELVVINGSAHVEGSVQQNMVLVNSTGDLGPSARIGKDLLLYRSTVTTGVGAKIAGTVHNEVGMSFGARALWFFWLSFTLAMVAAGVVLAYLAGEPLGGVADGLRYDWRGTLLATLVIIVGLPFTAIISFMSGIGFVLGFFILFFIIPVLSLVGYLIAGASLGRATMNVAKGRPANLYIAVALGVFMLQVAAIIPGIGGLLAILASQLGAGALVHRAWAAGRPATAPSLIVQPA
jgi:hypothetical protein